MTKHSSPSLEFSYYPKSWYLGFLWNGKDRKPKQLKNKENIFFQKPEELRECFLPDRLKKCGYH